MREQASKKPVLRAKKQMERAIEKHNTDYLIGLAALVMEQSISINFDRFRLTENNRIDYSINFD